jgi:hypothetical protein
MLNYITQQPIFHFFDRIIFLYWCCALQLFLCLDNPLFKLFPIYGVQNSWKFIFMLVGLLREWFCVVCYMVHNGGHYVLEHLQMFVLLKFYTISKSMFGVLSCHKFLNLLTVFCHPPIPWLSFLYDPSPISVRRALFICYHLKFFLKTLNPSSHSIPIPCLLNWQS